MVERRLIWLAGVILLWGAAIFYKLILIELVHHHAYAEQARARQEELIDIPAPRGSIFDRNGSPLAMSVPVDTVHINPQKVDPQVAAGILSAKLHLDRGELQNRIQTARDTRRGYLVIERGLAYDQGLQLRQLPLDWIEIDRQNQRHYPKGSLAAHVVGTVNFEGHGDAGVEQMLDADLAGAAGKERLLTDVKRRGIDAQYAVEPKPGLSITLTIDERLQFVAEKELADAVQQHEASSGSVVVMDPKTGEILALASYPSYDPNDPPQKGHPAGRENHAVGVPFEPGSVFKVITLTAALETTKLRPESIIDCGRGAITLFGRTIHEAHGGYGAIPMAQVLAKSSNVGAIRIGMTVGEEKMFDYVRRFGFGQKTGIPLPGESRGRLRKLPQWTKTSLASVSMGQEVSVTTIQLAQAACIVANGGLLVRPRLVLRRGDDPVPATAPVRVINPETAITMRQMMEGVVMPGGTGYPEARLDGFSVGGKTGSAQIYDFKARHYTHNYNGSFMGFAPLNNPAIVVVVTLNGTHGDTGYGGRAAAPVFHAVTQEALRVLDVPKDLPDDPQPTQIAVARTDSAGDDLAIADLSPDQRNILEDSDDDEAAAKPAVPVTAAAARVAAAQTPPSGPRVPDFKGKTMRAVLAEAAAKGFAVEPAGSGIARVQYPPAGAPLRQGERIRVRFAR